MENWVSLPRSQRSTIARRSVGEGRRRLVTVEGRVGVLELWPGVNRCEGVRAGAATSVVGEAPRQTCRL